jgi:hypothetical protein
VRSYTQLDVPDFRACAHDLNKALLTCWLPTATLKATKRKVSMRLLERSVLNTSCVRAVLPSKVFGGWSHSATRIVAV